MTFPPCKATPTHNFGRQYISSFHELVCWGKILTVNLYFIGKSHGFEDLPLCKPIHWTYQLPIQSPFSHSFSHGFPSVMAPCQAPCWHEKNSTIASKFLLRLRPRLRRLRRRRRLCLGGEFRVVEGAAPLSWFGSWRIRIFHTGWAPQDS